MSNYEVLREFDAGQSESDLAQAVEQSGEAIEEMRAEGTPISYLGSEVFTDESGLAWATMCRYDADSEDTVREHSERSGLPLSDVFQRGTPLAGMAPRAGVVSKVA